MRSWLFSDRIGRVIVAFLNLWPRLSFFICFVCFLSFVSAAREFSNYQSDGMLLEAGFIALSSCRVAYARTWCEPPPSRASLFLLQWEWFRIYFESGMVKLVSGDRQWRNSHRNGRVLPERPIAHVDRLVR